MDPDALEKEIHAIYGLLPEPLPLEAEMADGPHPGHRLRSLSRKGEGEYRLYSRLAILDAAGNRARGGLRVVEDYVRFALDDRHLTRSAKPASRPGGRVWAGCPRAIAWPGGKPKATWARR